MFWPALILVGGLIGDAPDAGRLLDEGIRAHDAMELSVAYQKLKQARAIGSDKERPRIDLWLSVVELERGRDSSARRHMKNAFAGDPRLDVPDRLSPRVHALADELRPTAAAKAPPRSTRSRSGRIARAPRTPAAALTPPAMLPVPAPVPVPASTGSAPTTAEPPPVAVAAAQPLEGATSSESPPTGPPTASPATEEPGTAPDAVDAGAMAAAPVSPFLVAGAGATAVAAGALVGAFALGVMAKSAESEAHDAQRASDATDRYQDASTASLAANALFVASALAGTGAAVSLGLWLSDAVVE